MCEQVVAPPPKPAVSAAAVAAAAAKAKQKERARMDANVEKEVDRIIDSQDNEYVLSRPKCALPILCALNQIPHLPGCGYLMNAHAVDGAM